MKPLHLDQALRERGQEQSNGYTSRVLRGERKKLEFERVGWWASVIRARCRELGKPLVNSGWLAWNEGEMFEAEPHLSDLEVAIAYRGDRLSPEAARLMREFADRHPDIKRTAWWWGEALRRLQRELDDDGGRVDVVKIAKEVDRAS